MRAGKSPLGRIAYQDALTGQRRKPVYPERNMSSETKSTGQVRVGAVVGGALKLIVRRPFSVFAWGLFTTLVGFAPLSVIFLTILPHADAAARAADMAGQVAASSAALIQIVAAYFLAGLLAVVTLGVVDAAVYRAVLEPENRGFFYLKVRRRELDLVSLYLLQALLWTVLAAAVAVPAAWIIGVTVNTMGRSWAVLVTLVAALAVGFVFAILALRLSLSGPMSFALGGDLRSSWRASRDRFGSILAVAIIVGLVLWLWTFLLLAVGH